MAVTMRLVPFGRTRLDDAQAGQVRVLGESFEDRPERAPHPALPRGRTRRVRGRRAVEERLLARLERGREEVVDVSEAAVERLGRHAGALAHALDRRARVAAFADDLHDRVNQALALECAHFLGWQAVIAGRDLAGGIAR
jgi:hypothetical protein